MSRQWIMDFAADKQGGALFSPCRKWRYTLWRKFDPDKLMPRAVNFIMLNPSTADELSNDPTVERCERRARAWGYDALTVTNLFAWRSTAPAALLGVDDPVGPDNDYHLIHQARMGAALVVCGWGATSSIRKLIDARALDITTKLRAAGVPLTYLRMSDSTGHPWHPLYVPYSEVPKTWTPPEAA